MINKIIELIDSNKINEAEDNINILLEKNEHNNPKLIFLLGIIYQKKNNLIEAETLIEKSISIDGKNLFFKIKYFEVLLAQKKFNETINFINSDDTIFKNEFEISKILSICYFEIKQFNNFLKYAFMCEEKKSDWQILYLLGNYYKLTKDLFKAESYYKKSLKLKQDCYTYANLSAVYQKMNLYFESIFAIKKSFRLNKFKLDPFLYDTLANYFYHTGKIEVAVHYKRKIFKKIKKSNIGSFTDYIWYLAHSNKVSPNFYFDEVSKINNLLPVNNCVKNKLNKKNKIIKLGFVSNSLSHSPPGYFLIETVKFLSQKFDLFFFDNSNLHSDEISERFVKYSKKWIKIHDKNDKQAFDIIKNENIDILFDINGLSGGNRISLFKLKPSPIQISWIGYIKSSGLKEIDYIIGDKYTYSKEEKYAEKFLKLDLWNTYLFPKNIGKKIKHKSHNQPFIFASYCRFSKINNDILKIWGKILNNSKNSKLLLKDKTLDNKYLKNRIIKRLTFFGAQKEQIILEGKSSFDEYLESFNKVNLMLDVFPFNNVTIAFDGYLMNTPILCIEGNTFSSRATFSINKNINCGELIAKNSDEYIEKAINISKDKTLYKSIIKKIVTNKFKLYDSKKTFEDLSKIINNLVTERSSNHL